MSDNPPPIDVKPLSTGDYTQLATPDRILFGVLADWGIWPDDHYPKDSRKPLGKQFAKQIGVDEAVEYWEVFDLMRAAVWQAHAQGTADGVSTMVSMREL